MKKLSIFILLIAVTFTSCSSDDDSANTLINTANLLGKWRYTASTENGKETTLDECDKMDTIEFQVDDVITSTTFFTNTVVNNGQTTTTCEQDSSESGEWSLSNSNLTIKFGNESSTIKILELTSTIVKFEEIDEYTDQEGNTVKDIYVDTYKKV